jgi:hypothetical protein
MKVDNVLFGDPEELRHSLEVWTERSPVDHRNRQMPRLPDRRLPVELANRQPGVLTHRLVVRHQTVELDEE